jgi:hypothetical protein
MAKMQAELEKARAEQIKRRGEAEARAKAGRNRAPRRGSAARSFARGRAEPAPKPAEPPAKPAAALFSQWIATLFCEAFDDRVDFFRSPSTTQQMSQHLCKKTSIAGSSKNCSSAG